MSRRDVSVTAALIKNLPRSKKLLVAVSGGIDSMVLLDALVRVKRLLKADVGVAHVDHQLRKDSADDLAFVKSFALKHNLPFFSTALKTPDKKQNLEAWGRKERYKFFRKIKEQNNYDYILTAHHSSDVAENFLMRLVSNKELRGIEISNKKISLLRPLLHVSKKQISLHQKKYSIPYKTDSTNSDNKFLRNRVRNRLIPLLEAEFQQKAQVFLAERASELAEDLKALDTEAIKHYKAVSTKSLPESARYIASLATPIAWRVVDLFFLPKLGYRIGRSKSLLIVEVLQGKLRKLDLPDGIRLYWHKKALVLEL